MQEHGLTVLCVCISCEIKGFSVDYIPNGIQLFEGGGLTHSFLGVVNIALHEEVIIGRNVCINDGVQLLTASHDVSDL
ncbi:hypothetical protein ACM55H_10240 [Flavobacterium sp. ZT3R17]|uniref:hypothetical protein n=1 Tax=Flavobacterium cryoconiti TaxID=3398736 RepID=UPI003A88BA03